MHTCTLPKQPGAPRFLPKALTSESVTQSVIVIGNSGGTTEVRICEQLRKSFHRLRSVCKPWCTSGKLSPLNSLSSSLPSRGRPPFWFWGRVDGRANADEHEGAQKAERVKVEERLLLRLTRNKETTQGPGKGSRRTRRTEPQEPEEPEALEDSENRQLL